MNDPALIARVYNLGLKIVPNLAHVLALEDLEYWEDNLGEIKGGVRNGFVRSRGSGIVSPDPRFELIATFEVVVPKDYDHATRLDSFAKKHRKEFYSYNDNVTDANFAKATQKLVPGKTYGAKIWGIKRGKVASSPDCLAFYKAQKAILVGAQGLAFAWEQKKEEFPKGKWTVSFDKKDALPCLDGFHRVPNVYAYLDGDFEFDLGGFGSDWSDNNCLLCFCDEE